LKNKKKETLLPIPKPELLKGIEEMAAKSPPLKKASTAHLY
jgi:hypothetical protein